MIFFYKFIPERLAKCVLCLLIGFFVAVVTSISTSGFYYLWAGDVPDVMLMISTILGSFFGGAACITVSPVENRKIMILYYILFDAFLYVGETTLNLLQGHEEDMFFASWWQEYLFSFVSVSATYFGCVTALRVKRQKKEVRHE